MCFGRVCVVYVVVLRVVRGLLTGLSQLLSLFSIVRGKKRRKGEKREKGGRKKCRHLNLTPDSSDSRIKIRGRERQKEKTENAGQCEGCWTMKELTRAKTESWH